MSTTTYFNHSFEFEYEGQDYEAEFEVGADLESDGIGKYEYWGQKCFDRGNLRVNNLFIRNFYGIYINGKKVENFLTIHKNLEKEAFRIIENKIDKMDGLLIESAFESLEAFIED